MTRILLALLMTIASAGAALAQRPAYPVTRKVEHVDQYPGGATVDDPYHWLEDDTASAVKSWVEAQNKVTFAHLEAIPFRMALKQRLTALLDYPRVGLPVRRGKWLFFAKNTGLQNQSVWYVQEGPTGTPATYLDPNVLSPDGTTRVSEPIINRDATLAAHTVSQAGSDWQEIQVRQLPAGTLLPDRIRWVKVSGVAWWKDGFFYSRYPTPADTTKALSSKNEDHRVYYHRLGTPQDADRLVFADAAHPQRFHMVGTTHDERYALLTVSDRGQGKDGNALYVRDLGRGDTGWTPIVTRFEHRFSVVDNDGATLIVATNRGAANERLVRIDPAQPDEAHWVTIVKERPEAIAFANAVGGHLFVGYLKDAATHVEQVTLLGTPVRTVRLPGIGTAGGFAGERGDADTYFSFSSFTAPPTSYRLDVATGKARVFVDTKLPFDQTRFETQQVFFTSKDGTRVPMFIVAKKGMKRDGRNPTLMYGYGGFNIALTPTFSATRMAWLEQGGVYVQVTLRGGSEYGDRWHEAGMKEKKQNVFDDFIAAAEWLVANKVTSSDRLAMQGGSNGGLLVGAVMTQRPDLFEVAIPEVGVMDMLRFHKFTIGWNWIADYGSSDDPAGYQYLKAYSPLHNLKPGTNYPATLVTTADHDDRVVPAHSFKFAAALQAAQAGTRPTLIRIETRSGHGASSVSKQIEEAADVYAFTMQHLRMKPEFPATPKAM
ncbi:MAG: S9 family peptidase [Gemmatimonadetes bacterium]|nr:S9 family peptidase [Gemmatimonadota bacterium]